LLWLERDKELRLKYKSIDLTNTILKHEDRAIQEVRENEARLFRLYAKWEDGLKKRVAREQGEIINLKKQLHFYK